RIPAQRDPRLPGGGGYPVCDLYDIKPEKFGLVDNVVTQASRFGPRKEVFTGIDATFTARYGRGGTLAGGVSTGHTVTQCVNPDLPTVQFCNNEPPFTQLLQLKVAGNYPLPWWGIQASANLQNLHGIPIAATYIPTNAEVVPSLGRNLAACGTRVPCTATFANSVFVGSTNVSGVQLMEPNKTFEPRVTQLDIRFGKTFQAGRARILGTFDIYNLFNANDVFLQNTRLGPNWRLPSNVLGARLFKFGAQVTF